jgi:IS605 OrfB family transposase
MAEITIPAYIPKYCQELQSLMFQFGKARRRAYRMLQKGMDRAEIVRTLNREGLNARYNSSALRSVESLPSHVTFGGLESKELRSKHKISREEYRKRRNSILLNVGQRSGKGNLNLRIIDGSKLKVNVGHRKWIELPLHIPKRYLERYGGYLDGSRPYTVLIKRRDNRDDGYEVKITIPIEEPKPVVKPNRVLAIDINSGHLDFACVEPSRVISLGRIDTSPIENVNGEKSRQLLYKLARKIGNLASHFKAKVVVGRLNIHRLKSHRRVNRKVHRIPFGRLRRILEYKLLLRGIPVQSESEAYTSKVGKELSSLLGLDVHKCSAIAFALKTLGVSLRDETDGRQIQGLTEGCGLTALVQPMLGNDESRKGGGYTPTKVRGGPKPPGFRLPTPILHVQV